MINKTQLQRLLDFPTSHETIFGVVGRMKVLLDFLKSDPQYYGFVPFLQTYYYITKDAAQKYVARKHFFWSLHDYEQLDIYFAKLYFKPMLTFLEHGEMTSPWKQYFEYCQHPQGVPFLQMLLGINAHINCDLYKSLIDLEYKHQHDFFLVNDILLEVTPQVMQFLAVSHHDIIGVTGMVWKDFAVNQLQTVIERWRSEAWVHATLTPIHEKERYNERMVVETEHIGEKLIRDFIDIYHMKHLPQIISHITSSYVRMM